MVDESKPAFTLDGGDIQGKKLYRGVPIAQFGMAEDEITRSKDPDSLLDALRGLDQRIAVLRRAGGSSATEPLVDIARTEIEKFKQKVEDLLGRDITLPDGVK